MAVELGLNRYISHPPHHENDFQLRERRNRERTYLVLFVHDRSLSTQTGRNWMLPEDEIVQHSNSWHEDGGAGTIRPEDVILAAFVQLRRIAVSYVLLSPLLSTPPRLKPLMCFIPRIGLCATAAILTLTMKWFCETVIAS